MNHRRGVGGECLIPLRQRVILLLKELHIIHLDFESRSAIDIWEVGAWAYSQHSSTEILCLAYAIDEGPVKILTYDDFLFHKNLGWPCDDLFSAIAAGTPIAAYNAFFEESMWQNIMVKHFGFPRVPIKQWRCVMAKALAHSLPRSLKDCAKALNSPVLKDEAGQRTMLKLCKPNKDGLWNEDPADFQKLYEYCVNDVETERAVDKLLPDLIPSEQTIWFLDQLINQRGIYVDQDAIQCAINYAEAYSQDCKDLVVEATNGQLDGVSRRMAVLQWCQDQGVNITGYTKDDVQKTLSSDLPETVRLVLETKLQLGKTSIQKYQAMQRSVSEDGRIRDILIYHGANTGRWAGKLVQLHNLPKGNVKDIDVAIHLLKNSNLDNFKLFYPDVMGTLSSCVRGMIIAAPGEDLLVGDYSAIEARVLMWLADEEYGLKQFQEGVDLYVNMARIIYNDKTISKGDPRRQLGKAVVLGCGYQMGALKFAATCTKSGLPISEKLAQKSVETYRTLYSRVRNFWFKQEQAAITTVQEQANIDCGKIRWEYTNSVLVCQLPSGRNIVYNTPTLEYIMTSWGDKKLALHYMGVSSQTKKWERQVTYGGKLVENITQAVARDIMAEAMLRAERKNYSVALSVHDEIVVEVPENFGTIEEYEQILCTLPSWANGCPIAVEAWRGKRYKK